MFCPCCQRNIEDNSQFCSCCGKALPQQKGRDSKDLHSQTRSSLQIDPKYIKTEGTILKSETIDFPGYYLDLLLADQTYSKFLVAFKDFDTGREYKRKDKSSFTFLPKISLWGSAYFHFEGCEFATLNVLKSSSSSGPCVVLNFVFPQLRRGFGDAIFKFKIVRPGDSKERFSAEIKGNPDKVLGLSMFANDNGLVEKIGKLTNPTFSFYKDIHGDERCAEVRFHVLKNPFRWIGIGLLDNAKVGVLEVGMSIDLKRLVKHQVDYQAKCKLSFEVALKIAQYLKPMWTE